MHPIQYFLLLSFISLVAGLYKIFEKAGEKGWKALIPIYQFVVWLRILKKPWWWIILILIPTISWLMLFILFVETSKAFGKRTFQEHCMALFGFFIYMPFLGFGKENVFIGPPDESKIKRTLSKEWAEAGIFAVIAATIIRTFFIEAFTIPTSSLEKSLLVGDYLFVSKVSYGAKVPNTPLSFPFAHNVLPFTEGVPSYLEWVKLPNFRLPGLGKVERNDYVVFNFPEGDTVEVNHASQSYYGLVREYGRANVLNPAFKDPRDPNETPFGNIIVRPVDKLDNYVKRCVALPGDKFEIRNKTLFINNEAAYVPPNLQYSYDIDNDSIPIFENRIGQEKPTTQLAERLDITDDPKPAKNRYPGHENLYPGRNHMRNVQLTASDVATITSLYGNTSIFEICDSLNDPNDGEEVFPYSPHYKWTKDNYGPLPIPKEGVTVQLDSINLPLYARIISLYEGNKLERKNGAILINGKEEHSYTFRQNYYFMMGDNRHNSLDSRYWGFAPEDHIVGKPVFIWMSLKKDVPFGKKFRWKRFFTFIQRDSISRSYLLYALLLAGGIWAWVTFRGKKQVGSPAKEILNKGKKK
jgi:signal peptidase I